MAATLWRHLRGYGALLEYALSRLRVLRIPPVRTAFYRQVYFTGIEASATVAVLALLCGVLAVTQVTALVGGDSELVAKVLAWTVLGEIGPLLAATIVIARSVPAIATELALMNTRGEMTHLEQMGISPKDYLVVPRVAGVTLSVSTLTVYFLVVAIGGGLAASAVFQDVSFAVQLGRFFAIVRPLELAAAMAKALLFGLAISAISCYHGMHVGHSHTEVPQAAIKAVIRSLLAVFLLDGALGYLRLAL